MLRIKNTFPVDTRIIRQCGCVLSDDPDTDGVIDEPCEDCRWMGDSAAWKLRKLMDAEIKDVVMGNRPRTSKRPFGAVGNFAVTR